MSREKLGPEAIQTGLKALPNWSLNEGKLYRKIIFPNFVEAWAFMTASAMEAEKMNHHPYWTNVYGTVEIYLDTHSCHGISALDFALAEKIDALVNMDKG